MTRVMDTDQERAHGPRGAAPLLFLLLAGLLIGLALRFPLAPDETYYWEWSRRPALGYYDQGPMVAWWIRASCLLLGDTQIGIRAGIIAAAIGAQAFLYLLARDLFGGRAALVSLLFSSLTPLALAGGFVATYDPLVVLFWAMALFFSARAALFGQRRAWLAAGLAFGLGMLTKHTMALFGPCLLLFLAVLPDQRRHLRDGYLWAGAALALLCFVPNLVWQSQHDWMTFEHLFILTGKGRDHTFIRRLGDFLGSQVGVITPFLFFGLVGALAWCARTGRQAGNAGRWFLFCMGGPVLILFTAMTLQSKVQANWAVCGWLAPPVAYAGWLREKARQHGSWRRSRAAIYAAGSLGFCALLTLFLIFPEARHLAHIHFPMRWDQMNKLYGGREIGDAASAERARMMAEGTPEVAVGAATYDNASRLSFYMQGKPNAFCIFLGTRPNSYVLWNRQAFPRPGGAALIADDLAPDDPKLPPFASVFDRVVPVQGPILAYRPGVYDEPVHTFYLYRCYGYRPLQKPDPSTGE